MATSDIEVVQVVPEGSALLDLVLEVFSRYVKMPDFHSLIAVVLWIAATHGIGSWHTAPRLVLNSPEKRCGKSRALDVIYGLCHQPMMTVNATPAAIFRSLEGDRPPTLILDEADTIFGSARSMDHAEDLRGLINAGYQRNRPVWRCSGPQQIPTAHPTFAMVALAGIGGMPDTITDRAVNVTMRRRAPEEVVAEFRSRKDEPVLHEVRDRLAALMALHADELSDAEPDMPVKDRAADTWSPLIAVADLAGGKWSRRGRAACLALVAGAEEADAESSLGTKLLTDIRAVIPRFGTSFIATADLLDALLGLPESPWATQSLNHRSLAGRLKPYGIKPRHSPDKQFRGYAVDQFTDSFQRYLPVEASDPSGAVNVSRPDE